MTIIPRVLTAKWLVLRSLGHIGMAVAVIFGIKYLGVAWTGTIIIAIKEYYDPHPEPFKRQFIYKSILDVAVWSATFHVLCHFLGV